MLDVELIRDLLSRVPSPPEQALPAGISDEDLAGFERRTSISLPNDVRDWLAITNGPCVGPGGLYGVRSRRRDLDIETFLDLFPSWRAHKWIPIAGDGCGNYYVIATQSEFGSGFPVLFIEPSVSTESPSYIVASGIGMFLVFLLESELGVRGWPFNEKYVSCADPEITRFVGLPLPWSRN